MNMTPQKMLALGLLLPWISVALLGFVAYHQPKVAGYFLAMVFLALASTVLVLVSWRRSKQREQADGARGRNSSVL